MSHSPAKTETPICPHCGAAHPKPWDLQNDEDFTETVVCHQCSGAYEVTTHIKITYSTKAA